MNFWELLKQDLLQTCTLSVAQWTLWVRVTEIWEKSAVAVVHSSFYLTFSSVDWNRNWNLAHLKNWSGNYKEQSRKIIGTELIKKLKLETPDKMWQQTLRNPACCKNLSSYLYLCLMSMSDFYILRFLSHLVSYYISLFGSHCVIAMWSCTSRRWRREGHWATLVHQNESHLTDATGQTIEWGRGLKFPVPNWAGQSVPTQRLRLNLRACIFR